MITAIVLILTLLAISMKIIDALAIPVFLVFLVLKLCGVITFGWFWVCFPLIIFGIALLLAIISGILLELIGD